MSRDADLMLKHVALMQQDLAAVVPLVLEADEADRNVLRGTSFDGASGSGGVSDPTGRAALSMKRETGRALRREARDAIMEASQLMTTARARLERVR